MLRCQFLCYVLKTFYIKIALKLSYFCKKVQNFRALGAPPPNPKISPPIANFWLRAGSIFGEELFFALHLICSPEQNHGRGSSPQC